MNPDFVYTSRRVVELLDSVSARRCAQAFHDASLDTLQAAGFDPVREVVVRLGKRRGFIDLVLDGWFALELDHVTPRAKSILKVRAFGCGMVYCRRPRPGDVPRLIWG